MPVNNLVSVGKIYKPHGVKGLLKVQFNNPFTFYDQLPFNSIFINKLGKTLPYFVASLEELADGQCLLELEEIDSREKAMIFTNCEMLLPEKIADQIFEAPDDEGEYFELVGYLLLNQDNEPIGEIDEVVVYPGNELAVVPYKGQEVLIPLNDRQIIAINEADKTIIVNIPDGLLDLNAKQ